MHCPSRTITWTYQQGLEPSRRALAHNPCRTQGPSPLCSANPATYRRGHFPDAPPSLGPTDAPRLRPPPAAMSRGSWRRLERAAARRGRRSGAEGRAPVSGAGGAVRGARRAEGRGGARPAVGGAAAGASRSRAPRRGGGVWCGEVGVPSAAPRSRSPSPGSAGPKSLRFGCVWLCLQSVCAFPSQNVAFGSHLHPQSHSIRLRGESV